MLAVAVFVAGLVAVSVFADRVADPAAFIWRGIGGVSLICVALISIGNEAHRFGVLTLVVGMVILLRPPKLSLPRRLNQWFVQGSSGILALTGYWLVYRWDVIRMTGSIADNWVSVGTLFVVTGVPIFLLSQYKSRGN